MIGDHFENLEEAKSIIIEVAKKYADGTFNADELTKQKNAMMKHASLKNLAEPVTTDKNTDKKPTSNEA